MLKEIIKRNWHWFSIGVALTLIMAKHMEVIRGYKAIGGEALILPFLGIAVMFYRQLLEDGLFDFLFENLEDEDDGWDYEDR